MIDRQTRSLYIRQAAVLKALAHPLRVAIVDYLRDGERCVCDIAAHVGAERSNVSRHLAVMLRAGLVDCRREGLTVFYGLRTRCVLTFLSCAVRAARQRAAEEARILELR